MFATEAWGHVLQSLH